MTAVMSANAPAAPDLAGSNLANSNLANKIERLVSASEKHTYDPFQIIDWDLPIDDSAYHLPPELLPLHGTPQWEAMSEAERITYSRHECASLCAAGIWFESILMRFLLDHLYDMPADDQSHRYLLIEAADECRHSAMFGEYVRRAGTPSYRVEPKLRFGGKFLMATSGGAEAYVAVLAAEELLDAANRLTMRDERVHPTSAAIAKLHVLEEARHVSYAKAYLTELWPTMSPLAKLAARVRTPFVCFTIAMALTNPALYKELGIEDGYRAARSNALHRIRIRRDLGKLTGFLTDLGMIGPVGTFVWSKLGLMEG